MEEVRQRRKEEAAATRERISEIRRRMRAGESWQSRVNSLLAVLYPVLLLLVLLLGLYCSYLYYSSAGLREDQGSPTTGVEDILEEQEEAVEEILAEE